MSSMTLRRFAWKVIRPYRFYLLAMLVGGFFAGLGSVSTRYILKIMIDHLSTSELMRPVYQLAAIYVGVYVLTSVCHRVMDWVRFKILPSIKSQTAIHMFDYIKLHSRQFYQDHFSGSLANKLDNMVVNLEAMLNSADMYAINFMGFLVAAIVMYTVNPIFTIALVSWCVVFFVISILFSKKILVLSQLTSDSFSAYAGLLVDILSNYSSVRLFSRQQYETENLRSSIANLVKNDRAMLKYIMRMRIVQDISLVLLLMTMLYVLLFLYQKNKVTAGDFVLILSASMAIFQSMWFLASRLVDVYKSVGRCEQAMSMLREAHEVVDKEGAKPLNVTRGEITFSEVSFAYKDQPLLFSNLNLTIAAGSKVGLVGYSGSGKSTFLSLILRFYNLNQGKICIDGQDVNSVTQESLRQQISLIPQDITLFHRSLFDNIRYGKIDATQEEVIEASKKANCHDFISALPEGYNTLVGERGVKLSGGQRQRIAIARSFLENAPILMLDEATSSLDSLTERRIQESLRLAIQDRTTVVIAHRLSTLLEMDRILVFQHGKIIEDGSHQDLLAARGHYYGLWQMQSNGFLLSATDE